jgi:hypothetical protein
LATLIWWIFHQRIQRIEEQLKETGHKQTLQASTPLKMMISSEQIANTPIYA